VDRLDVRRVHVETVVEDQRRLAIDRRRPEQRVERKQVLPAERARHVHAVVADAVRVARGLERLAFPHERARARPAAQWSCDRAREAAHGEHATDERAIRGVHRRGDGRRAVERVELVERLRGERVEREGRAASGGR
jgi:hypothetical protein